MLFKPTLLPDLIQEISTVIETNSEYVTQLDQAIGDGDHVTNLKRGILALTELSQEISQLEWPEAFQKIGMSVMSTVGGASGSLYATLFISMSKTLKNQPQDQLNIVEAFAQGVEAVKQRGKADIGEKTMLDVLIPVVRSLQESKNNNVTITDLLDEVQKVAITGMESTRDMIATKGRASYLGERTIGHIDAGAKTSQLMICTIAKVLTK